MGLIYCILLKYATFNHLNFVSTFKFQWCFFASTIKVSSEAAFVKCLEKDSEHVQIYSEKSIVAIELQRNLFQPTVVFINGSAK